MITIRERSTIELKSFNLNYGRKEDDTKRDVSDELVQRNVDDLSKYPIVYLNGLIIEPSQIKVLKLNNDGFVPYLYLEFSDPSSKITDENFPTDNSIISVHKESNTDDFMAIAMDFKIIDFQIIKGTSGNQLSYIIDGILDIDGLYMNNFESYKNNSYNVLYEISKNIKLGFASNIDTTNDDMIWINPANFKSEFIKDVVKRSYIDDDSFLFGFIDFYYNFNYIDIEEQMKDDISNQMNTIEMKRHFKSAINEPVPLILTNHPDRKNTNLFIGKYTLFNSSTNVNLSLGYKHKIYYYDIVEDEVRKYNIDNLTTDDGNNIVMKGENGKEDVLYNDMVVNSYMGKQDNNNVHKNYLHTLLQNNNNLKFSQKLKMTIKLNKPNYSLYRFQKVLVELYNMGKMNKPGENKISDKEGNNGKNQYADRIINKLSGEWIITAINLKFSKDEGNVQEITLIKRELTNVYDFPRNKK